MILDRDCPLCECGHLEKEKLKQINALAVVLESFLEWIGEWEDPSNDPKDMLKQIKELSKVE